MSEIEKSFSRRLRRRVLTIAVATCALVSAPQAFWPGQALAAGSTTPAFPEQRQAPKGAPNVLIIMTDDVGFGASSTFGGPISTPTFDQLAKVGLRYNRFHTTALCSPTRAALLTGRNHHAVGAGIITEAATADEGYTSVLPRSAATFGEVLRENGYSTSWFGKNHNTPDWETGPNGPFDRWPTGLGFEYFYGFNAGETNQWAPALVENTRTVEPPAADPKYILDKDLADQAVNWLHVQRSTQPDKPFLMYFAPGTAHAPNHAPKEWIEKFRGKFDQGWDRMREDSFARQKAEGVIPAGAELTPRPKNIPAWESLSQPEKRLYAHMMEVYAGALAHADNQIGRVIEELRRSGQLDNTLIIYIQGDNGAAGDAGLSGTTNELETYQVGPQSLELLLSRYNELGGPQVFNLYPAGWAWAMTTPFPWVKEIASHFGGTRNGMVLSWPGHIAKPGGVRDQFTHVTDIAPTLYEAIGITPPETVEGVKQQRIEGTSLLYTLNDSKAPSRHTSQYFEILGNRAYYRDGWMASTSPGRLPWEYSTEQVDPRSLKWELYHVDEDYSQAHDLAAKYPERLQSLRAEFDKVAADEHVFPLMASSVTRLTSENRPYLLNGKGEITLFAGSQRYPSSSFPDIKNRSWTISAKIEAPAADSHGVIVTQGGRFGGWALMVREGGRPAFVYKRSTLPGDLVIVEAEKALTPGGHDVTADFSYDGGGWGKGGSLALKVDGVEVGRARIAATAIAFFGLEGAAVGHDTETPVLEDYQVPYAFTGRIDRVDFRLRSKP